MVLGGEVWKLHFVALAKIGSCIIDGLAPSPQPQKKMQLQDKQRTHGNDFIASRFGSGYRQKYRSFRHFFGCQDPLMTPPSKEKCPNCKVDKFFPWSRFITRKA